MAMDLEAAAAAFRILATHLRTAGEGGLNRELSKAIADAAEPLKAEIRGGLGDHMPDRYAAVLNADLKLAISKHVSPEPGISLRATAAPHGGSVSRSARRSLTGRKLQRVNAGLLTHPVYGNREVWRTQTDGMKPGFFTGPAERSAPRVRREILAAMNRIADEVTRRT